jgi:hypothetical protein
VQRVRPDAWPGGGIIVNRSSDEGSDDDKADAGAARREYGTSTASNDDEAGATVKRLARPAVGKHARLRHPSGREATHAVARRSGATKVARCTGVGKVAADAIRDDVSIEDAYSDINAGDNTNNDAGCRAAKKRPYSPQDYTTNDGADEEARSTGADEGAPKAAHAAAAWGAAARGAATQRRKSDPKADHEATSEANQVKDSGKEADSEANRGRGKARTHPTKNRADAEALPKFSRGASARSREEDEPLDDAGMAKLEWHMAVRGTTAA